MCQEEHCWGKAATVAICHKRVEETGWLICPLQAAHWDECANVTCNVQGFVWSKQYTSASPFTTAQYSSMTTAVLWRVTVFRLSLIVLQKLCFPDAEHGCT